MTFSDADLTSADSDLMPPHCGQYVTICPFQSLSQGANIRYSTNSRFAGQYRKSIVIVGRSPIASGYSCIAMPFDMLNG